MNTNFEYLLSMKTCPSIRKMIRASVIIMEAIALFL